MSRSITQLIPLRLITGFLGAGKTTLMKNILNGSADDKVGIIVNEFGEMGMDGALLKRGNVKIAELTNGSIFCSCIKENFLESLVDMSRQDISVLFIEASGLADPSEMGRILEAVTTMLYKSYDYRGSVCVVDALTFPELSDILPALTGQVQYCDVAIINKADLVDLSRIRMVAQMITRINSSCEIIVTSHCQVDVHGLLNRSPIVERVTGESTNTPQTRPSTVVLKSKGVIPIEALRKFINVLSPYAYRIKGFLPTDSGIVAANAVAGHVNITPWTGDEPAYGLVVISSVGISIISRITQGLEGELKTKLCM